MAVQVSVALWWPQAAYTLRATVVRSVGSLEPALPGAVVLAMWLWLGPVVARWVRSLD